MERGCVCPQTGQVCSSSLTLLCIVLCGVFGSVPLGRASLTCLGCPCFGWPLPVCFSCGFFPWCCRAPPFRCCCSVVLVWLLSPFLSDLAACVLAVWPALSWLPPPSLPPWLSSGAFWSSQSCWSLPPDTWLYLQRSGCHTFGMACRGWLARVFPPLHGNKGFGPVCGFALSTMLWVLFMCPSLRHWGIRPRVIQNPLRTPLKLYAPTLACAAFSLLPLLPSRASALSLFAGLRLPSSPRALALFGLVCPPRCPLSWLVFLAPPPSWLWFVLLAWPGFCLFGFVWFFWLLVVSGCFLFFRVLRLLASPYVSLDWDIRIFCFHLHH